MKPKRPKKRKKAQKVKKVIRANGLRGESRLGK
jgi:hypothetical protein